MAATRDNLPAANEITMAIEGTTKWYADALTYAFTDASYAFAVGVKIFPFGGTFHPFQPAATAQDQAYRNDIQSALDAIARVAGIRFSQSTTGIGPADFKFSGIDNLAVAPFWEKRNFPVTIPISDTCRIIRAISNSIRHRRH